MEALYVSIAKYSMFEYQMSRIMAPWIQYMHKKFHELLCKEFFQVLIYRDQPKAATTYKDLKLSSSPHRFSEWYEDSKKCRLRIMKHVEARLPSQNVLTVLVVLLDIQYVSVAKKIIYTEI